MRIQCPQCNKAYAFSADDLSHLKNELYCKKCRYQFNRLKLLKEVLSYEKKQSSNIRIKSPLKVWRVATGLLAALFAFQVYFFEWEKLAQNATLRPWLNKICLFAYCQLPVYKNLNEFSLLHGAFEAVDNHFIFKTALTNQANFPQETPSVKLILINYTGNSFAERVFLPRHYNSLHSDLIEPEASIEIEIEIATPTTPVGGYRFELI